MLCSNTSQPSGNNLNTLTNTKAFLWNHYSVQWWLTISSHGPESPAMAHYTVWASTCLLLLYSHGKQKLTLQCVWKNVTPERSNLKSLYLFRNFPPFSNLQSTLLLNFLPLLLPSLLDRWGNSSPPSLPPNSNRHIIDVNLPLRAAVMAVKSLQY